MVGIMNNVLFRNIMAVSVGILVFFLTDTLLGCCVALFLEAFTELEFGTIIFDIMVRLFECIIKGQILLKLLNFIAIRNQKGINVPELIVGTFIIICGLVTFAILIFTNSIIPEDVIYIVFNTLLGILHISDAKEQLI